MPTYDYRCQDCENEFENFHRFNDAPSPCEKCGSENLERLFNEAPMVFTKGDPTTLGQLAESNTKGMGKYELEDKREYQNAEKKKKEKDWWKKSGSANRNEINKMTKKQKAKYIKDGKGNGQL